MTASGSPDFECSFGLISSFSFAAAILEIPRESSGSESISAKHVVATRYPASS